LGDVRLAVLLDPRSQAKQGEDGEAESLCASSTDTANCSWGNSLPLTPGELRG